MAYQSLASRYRPQRFAEVVGQPAATAALSAVSSMGAPAPAYLLSGTRGVGKTTIARIFAKALNCANGPAAEPCNECAQCRQITDGAHVDVCEIDAASNTGVDDVRALRENLGFMPMNGRFKIFIIDEAHMLSKSAFNALLKTLEEPPGHTVFIFATTEAHRFPATIVSRCQHYVFRHLPEDLIKRHLRDVLTREGRVFEEAAVALIARRAAGSARDSLSLLDQALAFGAGNLTAAAVAESLGLAGQEFYARLLEAIAAANTPEIVSLAEELLGKGVDIGFFLRELINYLRSLFLYSQSGEVILPPLQASENEGAFLRKNAGLFSPGHLHAAWQMALQSQRGILQSSEPGSGLELLLLNLSLLPKLLPIEKAAIAGQNSSPDFRPDAQPRTQVAQAAELRKEAAPFTAEKAPAANDDTQPPTWAGFCEFCRKAPAEEAPSQALLKPLTANWQNDKIIITPGSAQLHEQLEKNRRLLNSALYAYCKGKTPVLEIIAPQPLKTRAEMLADCRDNPQVKLCEEILGARLEDCYQKGEKHAQHE